MSKIFETQKYSNKHNTALTAISKLYSCEHHC